MCGSKDLGFLGQQVLLTMFLYFNLENQPIFTKKKLTKYGIYSKKILKYYYYPD